jgi:hypothetical protein
MELEMQVARYCAEPPCSARARAAIIIERLGKVRQPGAEIAEKEDVALVFALEPGLRIFSCCSAKAGRFHPLI